jgi:hypothetical protein
MDNIEQDKLFQKVYDHITQRGLPIRFPPSLLSFCTMEDVRQEFFVGVTKRLKKVKNFKEGTGTSPEMGYLVDGGVHAVQDYVRRICNRNLLPHCACKIWAVKKYDKCPKCGSEISYSTVYGEDIISESMTQRGPDKIVEGKLEIEKFRVYLEKQKAKKVLDLFNILCGHDSGPCGMCGDTCKGSLSDFEFRRSKWRSGCINLPNRVAIYWNVSPARVGVIMKQLTLMANKFIKNDT